MARTSDKRNQLIQAAQLLFHEQGIERSTLAHLATASGVPLGNIYYYFKTKDELIVAVVESQRNVLGQLFDELDQLPNSNRRLVKFVQNFDASREARAANGCPLGNLCQEANKFGGHIAEQAGTIFQSIIAWLEKQFRDVGCTPKRSKQNAIHVLSTIQGASLLANTFRDDKVFRDELTQLLNWLRSESEGARKDPPTNNRSGKQKLRSLLV